ncbi:D-tyrosyl-tRNA(Tyr) deacylase [bacterium]|nr:D-tyrosyl-tRNA(Tyr) deacylase [bacterium]
MKIVAQRVTKASVTVNNHTISRIGVGLVVFLGIAKGDSTADSDYIFNKITTLRLFPDQSGRFDKSITDINGDLLLVSQFTLLADCEKGRRPSFDQAATPSEARPLYDMIVSAWRSRFPRLHTGEFGADMSVSLTNMGPVTMILDSRHRP